MKAKYIIVILVVVGLGLVGFLLYKHLHGKDEIKPKPPGQAVVVKYNPSTPGLYNGYQNNNGTGANFGGAGPVAANGRANPIGAALKDVGSALGARAVNKAEDYISSVLGL